MKNTKEVIKGLEVLVKFGKNVAQDKKVNIKDLVYVKDLLSEKQVLIDAIKDINMVDDEIKEMIKKAKAGNVDDLISLGESLAQAIKSAIKN
jgi:hypothetical protein